MTYLRHAFAYWKDRLAEISTIMTLVAGAIPAAMGVPAPYKWMILIAAAMQAMVPGKGAGGAGDRQ